MDAGKDQPAAVSDMEAVYLWLVSGALLGLASSLHCVGMCTGISASILFLSPDESPRDRVRTVLLAHLGRAISYATVGSALGAAGAGLIGSLPPPIAYRMLQWAAAVAMMWIGLSTAGLLPSLAIADRMLAPLSSTIGGVASQLRSSPLGPFGMGLGWGLTPCAMVYGAYLTAMLTGSAIGGAITMLGFAAATLPALATSTLGLRSLAAAKHRAGLRVAVGLAIAATGFGGIYLAPLVSDWLCR